MNDFIQWWQAADFAAQATIIGAAAAVLALIAGFFVKASKSKVTARNKAVAAGGHIKNNTINIGAPPDKP